MNLSKRLIILSCLLTSLTCLAAKYQIKVLNTPTITIDNRQAKVGDWFTDESVIVWSRDNQAMRVISDENKVYTLSAKLYKEAKAKKFLDFITYTKPLATRGNDVIEKLAARLDSTFLMLDEIEIDLSGIEVKGDDLFIFESNVADTTAFVHTKIYPTNRKLLIKRQYLIDTERNNEFEKTFTVTFVKSSEILYHLPDKFHLIFLPLLVK